METNPRVDRRVCTPRYRFSSLFVRLYWFLPPRVDDMHAWTHLRRYTFYVIYMRYYLRVGQTSRHYVVFFFFFISLYFSSPHRSIDIERKCRNRYPAQLTNVHPSSSPARFLRSLLDRRCILLYRKKEKEKTKNRLQKKKDLPQNRNRECFAVSRTDIVYVLTYIYVYTLPWHIEFGRKGFERTAIQRLALYQVHRMKKKDEWAEFERENEKETIGCLTLYLNSHREKRSTLQDRYEILYPWQYSCLK